jgi:hypothetical protein
MKPSEHMAECAKMTPEMAQFLAVHDQLELRDEIERILNSDHDVSVKDGIATALPKNGSNW